MLTSHAISRLAKRLKLSDPVEDVVRGIENLRQSWWHGPEAKKQYQKEMDRGDWGDWSLGEWIEVMSDAWEPKVRMTKDQFSYDVGSGEKSLEYLKQVVPSYVAKRGWFIKSENVGKRGARWVFEKRRGDRIEIPRRVWHATPAPRVESILRKGLIPKTRKQKAYLTPERRYPDRIYVTLKRSDAKEIAALMTQRDLMESSSDIQDFYYGGGSAETYIVLRIDTSQLRKGTKFFTDPDYPKGAYTYTPIPPSSIRIEGDYRRVYEDWKERQGLLDEYDDRYMDMTPLEREVLEQRIDALS